MQIKKFKQINFNSIIEMYVVKKKLHAQNYYNSPS